jgi:putative transcriptional regulator
MMTKSSDSPATPGSEPNRGRVDWDKLRSQTRADINRIAREQRAELELPECPPASRPAVSVPDVRAIREKLGLSQAAFAARFHLRERTVQQWEQGRAVPDQPARVLLRAIERYPEAIAHAAAAAESGERR